MSPVNPQNLFAFQDYPGYQDTLSICNYMTEYFAKKGMSINNIEDMPLIHKAYQIYDNHLYFIEGKNLLKCKMNRREDGTLNIELETKIDCGRNIENFIVTKDYIAIQSYNHEIKCLENNLKLKPIIINYNGKQQTEIDTYDMNNDIESCLLETFVSRFDFNTRKLLDKKEAEKMEYDFCKKKLEKLEPLEEQSNSNKEIKMINQNNLNLILNENKEVLNIQNSFRENQSEQQGNQQNQHENQQSAENLPFYQRYWRNIASSVKGFVSCINCGCSINSLENERNTEFRRGEN